MSTAWVGYGRSFEDDDEDESDKGGKGSKKAKTSKEPPSWARLGTRLIDGDIEYPVLPERPPSAPGKLTATKGMIRAFMGEVYSKCRPVIIIIIIIIL